jgi:hypothetical protein
MILQDWIRQAHRWLGILLTLAILANFVARVFGPTPMAVVYAPLAPLALLVFSGLFLFFQPRIRRIERSRSENRALR